MGLTVDLGLGRFDLYWNEEDPEPQRLASVRALVETGCTDLLREILLPETGKKIPPDTRIYEARRTDDGVEGRFLSSEEAEPILEDLAARWADFRRYAAFSWEQLEEVGAHDVQSLAVPFDQEDKEARIEVTLPDVGEQLRMVSIERSWRNFQEHDLNSQVAWQLHEAAQRSRLIVHCA